MLSRTASNLYWTARYIERADYLARILDATMRLASLPKSYGGDSREWDSAVASAGAVGIFNSIYTTANERTVREFLAFSPQNPSSIRQCLSIARTNARAVRTALTVEMWETINDAWHEMKRLENPSMGREEFTRFLEFVKGVSLSFDGSAHRTMLRNDGYWFMRLGSAVERADNTARILDVKYHVLLPESEQVGGSLDYFHWTTILREVSALTAYRWVYRESVKPWLVADLLILNRQMPRSLMACYDVIVRYADMISESYGRRGLTQRLASGTLARLSSTRIEDVFQQGLHEFILGFIAENDKLGSAIAEQYLS
ncbi:putative alpha-E superfamily protein [Rhodoligotrophos appendicifer]|uniref:alpha-E domain-containing protein n=1 Tax=Rhodoligotrophos appendicifer TaxID=987056 RepID=UPI001186D8AE|nr:alpha-E domain-containing protein [Rhodoligotrophos appendicifer]